MMMKTPQWATAAALAAAAAATAACRQRSGAKKAAAKAAAQAAAKGTVTAREPVARRPEAPWCGERREYCFAFPTLPFNPLHNYASHTNNKNIVCWCCVCLVCCVVEGAQ
jgi:hypothetical protein